MTLMANMGSEARSFDFYTSEATPQYGNASTLEQVYGRGLDSRERAGVSAQFLARFKLAMGIFLAVAVLCVARIGVYSAAVGVLADNASMRTELKTATDLADDLRIQRSVLSSTQRIDRIATQSYGMVLATGTEQMSTAASDNASSSDDATSTDVAEQGASDAASQESSKLSSEEVASQLGDAQQTQGDGSAAGANAADVDSLA